MTINATATTISTIRKTAPAIGNEDSTDEEENAKSLGMDVPALML